MNKELTDLALQIGGSHYPTVSKQYLPLTVKLVLEEMASKGMTVEQAKQHWGIK